MSERTPGPLTVGGRQTGPTTASTFGPCCGGQDWDYVPVTKDGETIAICPARQKVRPYKTGGVDEQDIGTALSNARFIVKAWNCHDELVAALKSADAALRFHPGGDCRSEDDIKAAKTALALAKQEAPLEDLALVTVCSECLRASCWQGKFYCDNYQTAGAVQKTIAELKELDLENPDYWKQEAP